MSGDRNMAELQELENRLRDVITDTCNAIGCDTGVHDK
jgi:hypothetical protein